MRLVAELQQPSPERQSPWMEAYITHGVPRPLHPPPYTLKLKHCSLLPPLLSILTRTVLGFHDSIILKLTTYVNFVLGQIFAPFVL
ncbi:hypothetical protein CDL15_Pgr013910 [Punica granatum]|uniref:Uncharacterized protein n=1 Tax=Punica granatum TaxID=22663 RepID=A0A218WAE1_PUNGR|nr:hypothetical protein CDL15_Pgr013910 [Punica granatum]